MNKEHEALQEQYVISYSDVIGYKSKLGHSLVQNKTLRERIEALEKKVEGYKEKTQRHKEVKTALEEMQEHYQLLLEEKEKHITQIKELKQKAAT